MSCLYIAIHDAGASNHIIYWINNLGKDNRLKILNSFKYHSLQACVAGPAEVLWNQFLPDVEYHNRVTLTQDVDLLISGTGWQSTLEHDARRLARQLGIKSIAVLDHWTNYRERFMRYEHEEILPDELWVTDPYAFELAKQNFPSIPVSQLPNLYLESLVEEIQQKSRNHSKASDGKILYALEPIRQTWQQETATPGEFQALDFFFKYLDHLNYKATPEVRLRPHPSDTPGKYHDWIFNHQHAKVSLDPYEHLADSIAWADTVAGCNTYALVIALASDRRVVCALPPWAPPCVLPHPEIIHLRNYN